MRLWPVCRGDRWENEGMSVLLPLRAKLHEVEAALSAIGLYAPRGGDTLEWFVFSGTVATIFDALGHAVVHLLDRSPDLVEDEDG